MLMVSVKWEVCSENKSSAKLQWQMLTYCVGRRGGAEPSHLALVFTPQCGREQGPIGWRWIWKVWGWNLHFAAKMIIWQILLTAVFCPHPPSLIVAGRPTWPHGDPRCLLSLSALVWTDCGRISGRIFSFLAIFCSCLIVYWFLKQKPQGSLLRTDRTGPWRWGVLACCLGDSTSAFSLKRTLLPATMISAPTAAAHR